MKTLSTLPPVAALVRGAMSTGAERAVMMLLPSTASSTPRTDQTDQRPQQQQQQQQLPSCTARRLTAVAASCPSFAGFETTPTHLHTFT